jgi:hypothetical protein
MIRYTVQQREAAAAFTNRPEHEHIIVALDIERLQLLDYIVKSDPNAHGTLAQLQGRLQELAHVRAFLTVGKG